jgi:hypothetical protein
MPDDFDVFLSYHSGDSAWVGRLKSALDAAGVKVWLDKDQIVPGDRFVDALERGIQSSQSVVLVVSEGSMRSQWVREEFHLALNLSDSMKKDIRLIPALMQNVELKGFLGTREFVSFVDDAQFEQNVRRLCLGIHATPAEPVTAVSPAVPKTNDFDEVQYLEHRMEKTGAAIRKLWQIRIGAPLVSLILAGGAGLGSGVASVPGLIFLIPGAALVIALAGWGLTAPNMARLQAESEKYDALKDGLMLCRTRANPGCARLEARFWVVVENLGTAGSGGEAQA